MRAWLLFILLATGCATPFTMTPPTGFAQLEEDTRAIAANGVVFRVRAAPNEPAGSLEFWREALEHRMVESGYVAVEKGAIAASGVDGAWLEVATPYGTEDHGYWMAVFVHGEHLVIAEAGGEVTKLRESRPAIVAAVEALQFN